jgi:sialic acid synthase SpsE
VLHVGAEARIALGSENTAPSIMSVGGMRMKDIARAVRIVEQRQAELLRKWEEIHG